MNSSEPLKNLEDFKRRFESMSDEQLLDTFKADLGKPGWVSSRTIFHFALRDELKKRGYDYSAI